uniref:MARVEL domain-containing protein n=1 Tax=Strongyloides stercoralis TaxID=6248 RepID=A0A0K0DUQ2_STRER
MDFSNSRVKCQLHHNDNFREEEPFLEKQTRLIQSTSYKKNNEKWAERNVLIIIVIIQICVVFLWILHEAIRFDHSCSSQLSSSMSNTYPISIDSGSLNRISRSLNNKTTKEPEIITLPNGTLVKVISRKRKILVYKKIDDVNLDKQPGDKNSRGILVGRKKVRIRVTTPSTNISNNNNNLTYGNENKRRPIQRRYHLLTGANNKNLKNHYTSTKKESTLNGKVNTWLHGIVNPNDPQFTNKGEIRAVKVKVAKKKPRIDLEEIVSNKGHPNNYNFNHNLDINKENENVDNSQSQAQDTEKKVLNDVISNNIDKGNNIKGNENKYDKDSLLLPYGHPLKNEEEIINHKKNEENLKYININDIHPTGNHEKEKINDIKSNNLMENNLVKQTYDKEEEEQRFEEVPSNYFTSISPMTYFDNKDYYHNEKEEKEIIDAFVLSTTIDTISRNIQGSSNFTTELSRFSANTICILRTLLAFWCLGQLSTLIFFLIGLILNYSNIRCLFIPQIISEGLFTIIASIYCITITLFSIVLYFLVTGKEMIFEKLLKWLALSFIILLLVLGHAWILDKKIKYFKKCQYNDEIKNNVIKILNNDDQENIIDSGKKTPNIIIGSCSSNDSNYGSNNGSLVKLYSHGDYGRRLQISGRMAVL